MIRLFEMFAGYGGASFALKKANIEFECVGYSEIDNNAIKLYNQNHKNIKNYGDCSQIKLNELPDFDLLTGGFPCQDVSMAGSRDLSKGRTNLYKEILRIAEFKKPSFMLLENVSGLISMKVNERRLIDVIVNDLRKIGYDVVWKSMCSKDYGIPQNRERVWLLCKLGKWDFNEFQFPDKVRLILKLKDLLEKEVDSRYYLSLEQINKIRTRERFGDHLFDNVPEISNTLLHIGQTDVPIILIDSRTYKDESFKREYVDVSPTLMSRSRTDETPIIKSLHRRLTPRECFRLMGFVNDEIDLSNISDSQLYKLAGNGWDINIVSKLFKSLYSQTKREIELNA